MHLVLIRMVTIHHHHHHELMVHVIVNDGRLMMSQSVKIYHDDLMNLMMNVHDDHLHD